MSDVVEKKEMVREETVYRPGLNAFRVLAGDANLIPVYREFPADLETPVSVYLKLMDGGGPSFLLESVEGGEQVGRYSFVGVDPRALISLQGREVREVREGAAHTHALADGEDILDVLRSELQRFRPADVPGLPRFSGGAVGYLGYDVVREFERLPESANAVLDIPEAIFMLADTLVVFDHARHRLLILSNARPDGDVEAAYVEAIQRIERVAERLLRPLPAVPHLRWGASDRRAANGHAGAEPEDNQLGGGPLKEMRSNISRERFEAIVAVAKEHIAAGDIFQVVLSQRLSRRTRAHPFAVYRALRMLNPSPYMFYFDFGAHGMQVIGASPEMHVRLEDGVASVRPIAGTRPRGVDAAADLALAEELLADPKERAEHVMLVDLGRNDIGRVSEYGTVNVRDFMVVERYSHVMHLVSHVEGRLRQGLDAFDLMRATFPAGTVSGAPKVRAMEIIEELEGERRGLYAGAIGYFSYDGSMDTCITIRTMLMQEDMIHIQAGAGIVADSDPRREHEECLNKARALAVAVERAERGVL